MMVPPRLACVGDVEAARKYFYDLRTEASRSLNVLGHMEKPNVPSDLPTVQEVRKKLDELRQQKKRLIAQKVEADTCWQNAQARLKQVQTEIEEASSEILRPSQEQELLQLESQRSHTEKLQQELTELVAEQKTVETALATVSGFKDECPTCGQPISAVAKAEEVQKLGERLADLEGPIQGTREELNDFDDPEVAKSRLQSHHRALARCGKLQEEQSKVQAVQKPDTADLESRMTILAERINKGERVLEKAQQGQSFQQTWEAHVREKSSLEARIGLLDKLVEFFGPTGAMTAQGSGQIGSFAGSLNVHLAPFGYGCNFTLDPFEMRVISSTNNHCGLSVQQLSESERFRFSIGFQLALATATGIRLVVIDHADILDKERRKMLTALLLHCDIDQAIVLATGEELPPMAIPQRVKFFDLIRAQESGKQLAADRISVTVVQAASPAAVQLAPSTSGR